MFQTSRIGLTKAAIRRALAVSVLAVGALALAAGCGGAAEDGEAENGGAAGGGGTSEVKIVMKDNTFEPAQLTVKRGTVKIEYENQGQVVHNLVIQSKDLVGKDFQSSPTVQPGDEGEITAELTKAGKVHFICAYHMPGMEGDITIE